jgi:hypothetical protein
LRNPLIIFSHQQQFYEMHRVLLEKSKRRNWTLIFYCYLRIKYIHLPSAKWTAQKTLFLARPSLCWLTSSHTGTQHTALTPDPEVKKKQWGQLSYRAAPPFPSICSSSMLHSHQYARLCYRCR